MAERTEKDRLAMAELRVSLEKGRSLVPAKTAKVDDSAKQSQLVEIETNDAREKAIWEKYLFYKIIGKGGFSVVIALCNKKTRGLVAAKVVEKHKLSSDTLRLLQEEPIILRALDHPTVMPLLDFIESHKRMFLFFDYMKGGDLSRFIKERRKSRKFFMESEIQVVMVKLLEALAYIHSRGVIHRDVKPGNPP